MKTLKTLFLAKLADIYDAEKRLVKSLPKIVEAATSDDLKVALLDHLDEIKGHITHLEEVFATFGKKARGQTCEATVQLLEECSRIASDFKGSPAINAALIATVQKIEHYEMAVYSCLHEWSGVLGNKKAATLLKEILKEEIVANKFLNDLAHTKINAEAVGKLVAGGFDCYRQNTVVSRHGNPLHHLNWSGRRYHREITPSG